MKTYAEKLKDPRWQRKRLEIMERDEFTCRLCHSKVKTLNVHHRIYRKGKMPWDYEDDVFVTLCEDCHKVAEEQKESVLLSLGRRKTADNEIDLVAKAIINCPREITFLGWAAESLAYAVKNQLALESGQADQDDQRSEHLEEFKISIKDAVEHMHRALFYVQEKFIDA